MLKCKWLIYLDRQSIVCLFKTALLQYGRFFFLIKWPSWNLPLLATKDHHGGLAASEGSRCWLWLPGSLVNWKDRASTKTFFPSHPPLTSSFVFPLFARLSHFLSSVNLLQCKRWFFLKSGKECVYREVSSRFSMLNQCHSPSAVPALFPN